MEGLKSIKTTSIVDASKETNNASYKISYQYDDIDNSKTLLQIHFEIYNRQSQDIEGFLTQIGTIDYKDGNIYIPGLPLNEKTSIYIQEATDIIEEIKSLMI